MNTCANCQWFNPNAQTCQEPRLVRVVSKLEAGGSYQFQLCPVATAPEMVCDFHAKIKRSNYRAAVSEEK